MFRQFQADRRARFVAEGLCTRCGGSRDRQDRKRCAACREAAHAMNTRRRRDEKRRRDEERDRRAAPERRRMTLRPRDCEACGVKFGAPRSNIVLCPDCRAERDRRRAREQYLRTVEREPYVFVPVLSRDDLKPGPLEHAHTRLRRALTAAKKTGLDFEESWEQCLEWALSASKFSSTWADVLVETRSAWEDAYNDAPGPLADLSAEGLADALAQAARHRGERQVVDVLA
jgi:hypothetical protein